MDELVVKKEKFEKELDELKSMSKDEHFKDELQKFDENGHLFGLLSAKVTASDMNKFSSQLQDKFIDVGNKLTDCYKQFSLIYEALRTLDKEYLAGIVGSYNEAVEAYKKAEDAQKDANKTLEYLKLAVKNMQEFNEKVSYELTRIDEKNWRENANKHKLQMNELDEKLVETTNTINSYRESHEELLKELNEYKLEKRKYQKNFRICWISTIILTAAFTILLILSITKVI